MTLPGCVTEIQRVKNVVVPAEELLMTATKVMHLITFQCYSTVTMVMMLLSKNCMYLCPFQDVYMETKMDGART